MPENDKKSVTLGSSTRLLSLDQIFQSMSSSGSDLSRSSNTFLMSHGSDPLTPTTNILAPFSGPATQKLIDKRKVPVTKEKLFSSSLYVDGIDFVKDQNSYLNEAGLQNISKTISEDKFIVPSAIAGYKILEHLSPINATSYIFRGLNEATGQKAFIKLSPDFTHIEYAARFLNDWYMTSGLNPAPEERLWSVDKAMDPSPSAPLPQKTKEKLISLSPVTLPRNLPGILYPIKEFNMEEEVAGITQKSMALIYPDEDIATLYEYYTEKVREILPEKTSLFSGSIFSVPSEISGTDSLDRSSTRFGSENSEYVELANKVKQANKPLSLVAEILSDMMKVLKVLSYAHKHGICHNGISSHDILVSNLSLTDVDKPRDVFVTGWDFSFSIAAEDPTNMFRNLNHTNIQTLHHYMAPECSRGGFDTIDYRSDIYSFGVVMYELIVGCLPFRSDNLANLQRMILDQQPLQPRILGQKWISNDLNYVILRCLKKNPCERYLSVDMLMEDIEVVIQGYREATVKGSGKLKFKDTLVPRPQQIPMFRTSQISTINSQAKKTVFGAMNDSEATKLMILRGPSGTGKATLMKQIEHFAQNKRNFIVHWKYHLADNNVSKHASSMFAMHSVVTQILKSSEEDIDEWRDIFIKEIDVDLSILFGAIPSLETLLGPHYHALKRVKAENSKSTPEPSSRGPGSLGDLFAEGVQSEHVTSAMDSRDTSFDEQELNTELKYVFVFKKFFTLVSRKGLTVLLSNLHNCPEDEFILISEFLQFCTLLPDSKLNFVVSFKSDDDTFAGTEIPNYQQLLSLAESLEIPSHVIDVSKPDYEHFEDYVGKFTIKPSHSEMVRRIYDHVDGNLLSFNFLTRYARLAYHDDDNFWSVLDNEIQSGLAPSSIDSLISAHLGNCLHPESLRLLKFAAATSVNGYFSMSELMIVTGFTLKEVHELLQISLENRVIVPTGISYKVPFHLIATDDFAFDIEDSMVWDFATRTKFKFEHDYIRAYLIKEMRKDSELMEIHRECGLKLKRKISKEGAINVTTYLLMSSHIYRSCAVARPEDYRHYSEALIMGGRYAISTSNVALALRYFTNAMKFVHKDDLRRKLKVLFTQVQCNYLLKDYEESIRLILKAETSIGKDDLSLAHLKVCSLFSLKNYEEGMTLAIQSLQRLNIEVSSDPEEIEEIANRCFSRVPLSVSEIRHLKTLKPATNKLFVLATSFIMDMMTPTYILNLPNLRLAILCQLVQLMHRHGQNTLCAIPLLHLSNMFLQPSEFMSVMKALELADVALDTINRNKGASTSVTQSINESYLMLVAQFKGPSARILKSALLFDQHDDTKSVSFFIKNWMMSNIMFLGTMRGRINTSFSLKKKISFLNDSESSIFDMMAGLWYHGLPLDDFLARVYAVQDQLGPDLEFLALGNAMIRATTDQKFQLACDIIMNRAYKLLIQIPFSILHVWFYAIASIALLQCPGEKGKAERVSLAKKILAYFKVWSSTYYSNFGPEMKFLEAMVVCQDSEESDLTILDSFEEAMDDAQKHQNWFVVALANRFCAEWLKRSTKSHRRANEYAHRAFALFSTMNTHSQANVVKAEFPEISDSFNWAGVRNMISPEKPKLENTKFFDNLTYANPRVGSGLKNEYLDEMNGLSRSETNEIPKLNQVKSIQKVAEKEPTHSEWTEAIKLCLSISQSSSLDLIVQTLLESTLMFAGVDYGAVILNFQTDQPVIKAIGTNNNIFLMEDELLVSRADLVPYKLVIECLITGEITCKEHKSSQDESDEDIYYINNPSYSGLCIPIKTSTVIGAIFLESHSHVGSPKLHFPLNDSTKIDLLYLLCSQAAVSFSKSVVYTQMEVAKKAAEEATEEKASFLANMSHEIRTPFNSLLACSIFLLDTALTNIQKEYVETIKDSALVTLNIIDGILAFTKIEHGSFILENEAFSMNDTIEGAIMFSSDQTESPDLEFAFFNKCPQIEMIRGDPTRVRQIIINLVGNALKFTSKGYVKVTLDAKPLAENRSELQVIVEDTGIGIPEHLRSKVFGAFSQVDGSSRRVYGGSGLGLAISNKLAEIMNGRITFTSEESIGSIFCFTCPFEVTLNDKQPKVEHRDVCIVSQTKWKRLALKEVLEYYGATVVLFNTFSELVKDLREFEILIIDKNLISEEIKLKSSLHWKRSLVYVLARFGLMISDQRLKDIEADSLIFSPIKRKSVRKLLETSFDWKLLPEKVVKTIQKTILGSENSRAAEEKVPKAIVEPIRPLKILIAEDNPVNLRVALQHLKKLGYIADHAKDGVEVLEKCEIKLKEGLKYDVIFMDIQMPRKDGIEATKELRKSFIERRFDAYLPEIIALTANVAGEERKTCLDCGMIDFISKPILPEKLKLALQKVIAIKDAQLEE